MKNRRAYDDVMRHLWDRDSVRQIARQIADIAANALTVRDGNVRAPGSERMARKIVSGIGKKASIPDLVRQVQKASLQLSHPRFAAQQVAAPIPAAALVESVVAALNQSLAVWEMSPIATAIDRDVIEKFKELFACPRQADGSLVPGGAFANLTALLAARDALEPKASLRGEGRIAIVVGEQAHYSITRAAAIIGLGRESVFRIPVSSEFSTDVARAPDAFAAARKVGFRKYILVGSSGSTPTGSFDDLSALRQIANRYGAWLHVDAAHGAGMAFSQSFRKLLSGLDSADSLAFDPHKMMFMPLSAGGVLVRDGKKLHNPLQEQAPYLFGSKRYYPDIGQVTLACSQRFDGLKIWIVWRTYGAEVWDSLVSHVCDVAREAYLYCESSAVLEPVHRPQSNIFCFRLRGRKGPQADRRHWEIKEALNESGFAYISSTVLEARRVLRIVIMNPRTTSADVVAILRRIEKIALKAGV